MRRLTELFDDKDVSDQMQDAREGSYYIDSRLRGNDKKSARSSTLKIWKGVNFLTSFLKYVIIILLSQKLGF